MWVLLNQLDQELKAESDLQLTDSFRDKPCDSESESSFSGATTPCNPDLAVFY